MNEDKSNIDKLVSQSLNQLKISAPADSWGVIAKAIQPRKKAVIFMLLPWAAAVTLLLASTFIWINFNKYTTLYELSDASVFSTQFENNLLSIEDHDVNLEPLYRRNHVDIKRKIGSQKGSALFSNRTEKLVSSSRFPELVSNVSENSIALSGDVNGSIKETITESIDLVAETENIKEIANPLVSQETTFSDVVVEKDDVIAEPEYETAESLADVTSTVIENKVPVIETIPDLPFKQNENKNWDWGMTGSFSPLYSFRNTSNTGNDSYYETGGGNENASKEQAYIAYSGGVAVEYGNSRWSFSSGLYYLEQGQTIDGLSLNKITSGTNNNVIYAATSIATLQWDQNGYAVKGDIRDNQTEAVTLLAASPFESEIVVNQNFKFVEVPLMAKYKLIDKRVDVQLIGGISTNVLVDNHIHMEHGNYVYDLGAAENINKVNYNSLVGLGLQVPFTKNLKFQMQPLFRYALKPYNRDYTVDYYPYSFAVYSGVVYQF